MREKEEDKLLAELFLNLKGSKKKREDWISIAKKAQRLIDQYGSVSTAAQKLGVSYELLRSTASILRLPSEVQSLVKRGKILLDAAQRLTRIHGSDQQVRVANVIAGLRSHDARQVIQYAKRFPDGDLLEFRDRVVSSRAKPERIDVIVLPMQHQLFERLRHHARERGVSIQRAALELISDSLEKDRG